MKVRNLVVVCILALSLGFISCSNDSDKEIKEYLITFEDVDLGEKGYWNGDDMEVEGVNEEEFWGMETYYYNSFKSGIASFNNKYAVDYWSGFACSNHTDTVTPGYINQYSVITGRGANNSKQFAVANSDNATFECPKNEYGFFTIHSIMMTNNTYAYSSMRDGDGDAKQFNSEDEDWFKVIIKGYKENVETGRVDYYLADFRNGKEFLSDSWEKVDLSTLGKVDKIIFSFDSSDKSEYGMNNPAYVCIDNILFTQEIEK